MQYTGTFRNMQYTVTPTSQRTEHGEVKCAIFWHDEKNTDYIWFNDLGDRLVCQLNDEIAVAK